MVWCCPIWGGAALYGLGLPYIVWGCPIWGEAALYGLGLPYIW